MEDDQTRDAVALATAQVGIEAQSCHKIISQDSPLSTRSGHRVEVELDDCTPSHQVDFQFFHKSHPFAGGRREVKETPIQTFLHPPKVSANIIYIFDVTFIF